MPRSLVLVMALVMALAVAFTLSARELESPKADEKWITFETDGFRFISSASPRETQEIARDLLRMRAAIAKVTKLQVHTEQPTRVYIFPNERLFSSYRQALDVKNGAVTGLFAASRSGGNFILLRSDVESVDRIVYHELTHQFLENTTTGLPLWFNEGLAEYYSTFRTAGDKTMIGRPVPDHVRWLRFQYQSLIPLRELFATTRTSPIYTEGDPHGLFYAQSWALVHYLITDPDRRAQLGRFLHLFEEGKSVDEAFSGAFGMKFAELEQALRFYIRRVTFNYSSYALGDLAIAELPGPSAMPHDEVLHQLGYLLAHSRAGQTGTAERFFRDALAANPKNAGVYVDLGRLYDTAGRTAEANTAYEKAVQAGTSDAAVYLLAGRASCSATRPGPAPTFSRPRGSIRNRHRHGRDSARRTSTAKATAPPGSRPWRRASPSLPTTTRRCSTSRSSTPRRRGSRKRARSQRSSWRARRTNRCSATSPPRSPRPTASKRRAEP